MDIRKAAVALGTAFILFLAPLAAYGGNGVTQDTLGQNEKLRVSEELRSTSGQYTLRMQDDGNLVVYDSQGKGLWSSDTVGSGAVECVLQGDGNLLLKDRNGRAVWTTSTEGHKNAKLVMQDDGNLVLFNERGLAVWAQGRIKDSLSRGENLLANEFIRSQNRKYTLIMQGDGNLVAQDYQGKGLWSSDTVGSGAVECVLQGDGNLVLRDRNRRALWATNTDGYPNARLIMEDDGHVVLYKEGGVAFWSNGKINMGIKPDAPYADSAEDLEAGKAAIFMRGGEMIVGEVVDISSTRLVLQLEDGREFALDRIWMINFISTGWNFPEERKRLENNEHYLFFKNDQITSGRITDFSSTRRVFQFDTKEEVPIGRVRRIYFTNQLPPAYMSLLGEEGTGQKPRYVGTIAPAAYNANTGDIEFDNALSNLNNVALADLDNFMNKLNGTFGISIPWIENLVKRENIPPADVYMIARTASVTRRPIDTVKKNYLANRGQGWGVIAKRLGIKPGSKEFHALKNDDTGLLSKGKSQGQKKDDKKNR